MIKRTAVTAIGSVVLLAMIGCESSGDHMDNAGSRVEDRTNDEVDSEIDNVIDSAFDNR